MVALFIAIRWPLYTTEGVLLGWNSDSALFGLMARAMATGADVPVFFWGQPYLGTLTSLLTVLVAAGNRIGPLTLRIAAALQVLIAIAFFSAALARTFGYRAAAIAALWLIAGPYVLFQFTIAPLAEQLFLSAAVLFWFATRSPLTTKSSWFVMGMLFGCGIWLHQGVVFLAGAILVALLIERQVSITRLMSGLAGSAIGYLPVAVVLLRDDKRLYTRTIRGWSVSRTIDQFVTTLTEDLWLLISEPSPLGILAGCLILVLAAVAVRRRTWTRGSLIAFWTIVFSSCFWLFSTYPYPGAVRYIIPVLPMIYGFAAAGMVALWDGGRRGAMISALAFVIVTLPMYAARVRDSIDVATGKSEQYSNWPGGFDPRPTLQTLRQNGYSICYGEVWVAHKLEFLTEPTVRFVVVRTPHRTLPQSLTLIRQPVTKCFVENDGSVRALEPEEELIHRRSVELRARKAGLR
jgi:hypothetical protein